MAIMKQRDGVDIIIPARNEEFLQRTIDDILLKMRGDTEVIAILDGYWPDPGIKQHPKVTLIHNEESIGQRASTNVGAKASTAKYIMKCDAHCMFDEGFDVKLMADCEYDWTVLPKMYTLNVFEWECNNCGKRSSQGPRPAASCEDCGGGDLKEEFHKRVITYKPRFEKGGTEYMWFNSDLRVKYFDGPSLREFGDLKQMKTKFAHNRRDWSKEDITDVMCGVGAGWFLHRDRYWDLGGLDELHSSWGQMGVEIACKAWLSGGRHVVNKKTWFAHLFRTQGKGFSFPYPNPAKDQEKARQYSRKLWKGNKWEGQVRPIEWMINKFGPLPTWENIEYSLDNSDNSPFVEEAPTPIIEDAPIPTPSPLEIDRSIVYYTDNQCEERILNACRQNLSNVYDIDQIISVSLYPINFGLNLVISFERGVLTMFKQILAGLEASTADVVYMAEHDLLYHPSHFLFKPPRDDTFYYNENTYKVRASDGQAVFYHTKQTSGLVANRELLVEHYAKRIERVEKEGWNRRIGFEPGCHAFPRGIDDYKAEAFMSEFPNIDIRHSNNLTSSRFKKEQFRSQRAIKGWKLVDEVPGWGVTKDRFDLFLREVMRDGVQTT